ncbi:MAG: hypothetical protein JNJ73_13735 [Hyphomonadaceae bacterium]|nr:hypothetical protein [Hyphomonadaceae bacterium]
MSDSSANPWLAFLVGALFVVGVMALGLFGMNARDQQTASLDRPQIEAPRLPIAPPDIKPPSLAPPSDLPTPG